MNIGREILQDLLVCPKCKNSLEIHIFIENKFGIEEGEAICSICRRKYLIRDGVIDMLSEPKIIKQRGKPAWNAEVFDKMYKRLGVWRNGWEWDRIHGYPKEVSDYHCLKTKGALLDNLRPTANSKILDVGCGSGYFLFDILKKYHTIDIFLVGIDISKHNIGCLIDRVKEDSKTNILGIHGSTQELPFRNNTFEIVICSEVLEHLYDPEGALKEINRVLKSGGRLLISTPSRTALQFWAIIIFPLRSLLRLRRKVSKFLRGNLDETRFSNTYYDYPLYPNQLKKMLIASNFCILSFDRNLILPPKYLLKQSSFLKFLIVYIVKLCKIIEEYGGFFFCFLGLHSIVHCKKK